MAEQDAFLGLIIGLIIWVHDNPVDGNIINLTSVVEPRKPVSDYHEMEIVKARLKGYGIQEGVIGKISDESGRKQMAAILSDTPRFSVLVEKALQSYENKLPSGQLDIPEKKTEELGSKEMDNLHGVNKATKDNLHGVKAKRPAVEEKRKRQTTKPEGQKKKKRYEEDQEKMSDFSSDDHDTDYQPPKRDFLSHDANEDSGSDGEEIEKISKSRPAQPVAKAKPKGTKPKGTKETLENKNVDLAIKKSKTQTNTDISKGILGYNSSNAKLEELTTVCRSVLITQLELSKKMETFFEMVRCRDCIKMMYKTKKVVSERNPKLVKEEPVSPCTNMSLIMGDHGDESSNKEKSVDVTLLQESASGSTTDDGESAVCKEQDTDDLIFLGEARFGVTIKKEDIRSIEETSSTPEKFVLNLIEFLVTPEECKDMTVYGIGNKKKAMGTNMRRAIRSHVFNLYRDKFIGKSEEEKNKYWMEVLVYKMNDKIRGIRNGKYANKR